MFRSLQWVQAFVFNHRPSGRETQRVRVAVQSRRFLPMPLPLLCQSRSRRRPRWHGPGWGLDQGGHCQSPALEKKVPVDQTSARDSSVNFGPGDLGFLARGAKFAESETFFWSKSDKSTGPIIILSNCKRLPSHWSRAGLL